MIAEFQEITGQDLEKSRFYMESSDWNIEIALESFYEAKAWEDSKDSRPQVRPLESIDSDSKELLNPNPEPEGASSIINARCG